MINLILQDIWEASLVIFYHAPMILTASIPTIIYLSFFTDEDGSAAGFVGYSLIEMLREFRK